MRKDFQPRKPTRDTLRFAVRAILVSIMLLTATPVIQHAIAQGDLLAALFGCLFLVTLSTFTLVSNQVKRPH